MAVVLSLGPLSTSHPTPSYHYQYRHSPPLPTMNRRTPEKLSLPPISSLMRDVAKQTELATAKSPVGDHSRGTSGGSHSPHSPGRRSLVGSPRGQIPPTSPLPGISRFDFPPRSSHAPGTPAITGPSPLGYFAASPASTAPEPYPPTRSTYPPIPDSASNWTRATSPVSQRRASDDVSQQHARSIPRSTYPDSVSTPPPYSRLAQQRSLPTDFPPTLVLPAQPTAPPIDPQMTPVPYHHHQQYPVSTQPTYPQTTDRYICPTCQKAFSRPSSLKIHTYSHTGEKPFRCKHEGCGKYFSVRSNMKRHEKGCHGGSSDSRSARGASPANVKAERPSGPV